MDHPMNRRRRTLAMARVLAGPGLVLVGLGVVVTGVSRGILLGVVAGVLLVVGGVLLVRSGPPPGVDGPVDPMALATQLLPVLALIFGGFGLVLAQSWLADAGMVPWLVGPATG